MRKTVEEKILLKNPQAQERNPNDAEVKSSWKSSQVERAYSVGACKCQFLLKIGPLVKP